MTINSFEFNWLSIDPNFPLLHFNRTDPYFLDQAFPFRMNFKRI